MELHGLEIHLIQWYHLHSLAIIYLLVDWSAPWRYLLLQQALPDRNYYWLAQVAVKFQGLDDRCVNGWL